MWTPSLLLLATLVGCHSSMDDMNSMRSYIDDTRRETFRHLSAARAATTMQGMRDEMDTHRDGMTPMMADMDVAMDSMTNHCDGLSMGEMRAMHGEFEGEMTKHLSAIEASAELATAQVEVERHAMTIMSMMDGMDGAMVNMQCR